MANDDYRERTIQLSSESLPDPLSDETGTSLIVIAGARVGQIYKLVETPVRIGRASDSEFQLRDTGISRHHARLSRDSASRWWIEDLGSTNGTYVNGVKVDRTLLESGDHVKIGRALIHYQHRGDKKALEHDRAETAAIQSRLLPGADTFAADDVRLAALYRASSHAGGDWWWYDWRAGDGLLVVLGDVTGHGQASAMVTAVVAGCLHTLKNTKRARDPEDLLRQIHSNLLTVCGGKYWMASVAVAIDPRADRLLYWSAGAPPGLLLTPSGKVEVLVGQGANLGQQTKMQLGTGERAFTPGSRLLLYTDGITELQTAPGRLFGMRRLSDLLASTRGEPIEAARSLMLSTLEQSRHGTQDDDITFVLVDRPG